MSRGSRTVAGIPQGAWLLLAAAGMVLAVHVVRDWYQLFGPYLIIRTEVIGSALAAIAPFLLGAAILLGAVRWPAGGRWLVAGVAVLAALGVVRLGSDIVLALFMEAPNSLLQAVLIVLGLGASLAAVAAPALVALGLHAARVAGTTRRWQMVIVGVLGGAGLLGAFALVVAWSRNAPDLRSVLTLVMPHGLLHAGAIVATVLVAMAAVRAAPRGGALPEWLIAVGATVAAAVLGWSAWFQVLAAVDPDGLTRYQTLWLNLPVAFQAVGLACLAAGFALGRVMPERRDDSPYEPRPRVAPPDQRPDSAQSG